MKPKAKKIVKDEQQSNLLLLVSIVALILIAALLFSTKISKVNAPASLNKDSVPAISSVKDLDVVAKQVDSDADFGTFDQALKKVDDSSLSF
ncbi:MAG: hypothetical protein Q7S03_03605 [bacterium]|nr:hypothetical protein [bacterium]